MDIELLTFGGYGQFVWPAYIFTFVSCYSLFLRIKNELKKQEKIFLSEFKQLHAIKIKVDKRKKTTKEALSGSSV